MSVPYTSSVVPTSPVDVNRLLPVAVPPVFISKSAPDSTTCINPRSLLEECPKVVPPVSTAFEKRELGE